MIEIRKYHLSTMVLCAVSLHLSWAGFLFMDATAVNATAVHALFRYIFPVGLLIWVLGCASVTAFVGLMFIRTSQWLAILLLPQLILLWMSAAGAIQAIFISQFADGVVRPRAMIAADQWISVLVAFWYTIAIILHSSRGSNAEK